MTNEVRQARLAGLLPEINFTEFAVLFIMADTCRGDSREASLTTTELVRLSDLRRETMWRAIDKLGRLGYLRKLVRGNQFQASSYEVLPVARCADATSTEASARCADATCGPDARCADVTSTEGEHVALEQQHVAFEASARCTDATLPDIPEVNPEGELRKSGTSPGAPAQDPPTPPPQQQSANRNGRRPRCARHAAIANDADVPPCPACRDLRLADEAAQRETAARADTDRAAIRQAINDCPDCDEVGRLDDLSDCPNHPNFRQCIAQTP